ncbi:MAG: hypothetical protein JKX98_07675 [Alcanivoracaceae bacterium]|nr:hypothetical protein [Alcanivoracaceae bacterium]
MNTVKFDNFEEIAQLRQRHGFRRHYCLFTTIYISVPKSRSALVLNVSSSYP